MQLAVRWDRTSLNRLTSLLARVNSLIFPFTIHSDTITNWVLPIITPCSGKTFGWLRAFHLITSLQNL